MVRTKAIPSLKIYMKTSTHDIVPLHESLNPLKYFQNAGPFVFATQAQARAARALGEARTPETIGAERFADAMRETALDWKAPTQRGSDALRAFPLGDDRPARRPLRRARRGGAAGPGPLEGFCDQAGQNTGYVIHPEEILADNFALLFKTSPNVLSPLSSEFRSEM